MLAYVMDVLTLPKNPCRTSLLLIIKMVWCNTNLYLPWLWNLFLADHVITLSTESLVSALALSLESRLFNLQLPQVSKCLSVLISCCGPTRPHLILLFYLVISLVKTRHAWKIYARVSHLVVCIS